MSGSRDNDCFQEDADRPQVDVAFYQVNQEEVNTNNHQGTPRGGDKLLRLAGGQYWAEALPALAGSRIRIRKNPCCLQCAASPAVASICPNAFRLGSPESADCVMLEDGVHLGGDGPVVALDT